MKEADVRVPWHRIQWTHERWRGFMRHDFDNPTREIAYTAIRDHLGNRRGVSLAEVGFGSGLDFARCFKALHDGNAIAYTGFDIVKQFVAYAREEWPGHDFREGGFLDLRSRSFSVTYTRHTLEHLHPDMYADCLRMLLAATREMCVITWFHAPRSNERLWFNERDHAWINAYDRSKIDAIIAEAGFTATVHTIDYVTRDGVQVPVQWHQVYVLKRCR